MYKATTNNLWFNAWLRLMHQLNWCVLLPQRKQTFKAVEIKGTLLNRRQFENRDSKKIGSLFMIVSFLSWVQNYKVQALTIINVVSLKIKPSFARQCHFFGLNSDSTCREPRMVSNLGWTPHCSHRFTIIVASCTALYLLHVLVSHHLIKFRALISQPSATFASILFSIVPRSTTPLSKMDADSLPFTVIHG